MHVIIQKVGEQSEKNRPWRPEKGNNVIEQPLWDIQCNNYSKTCVKRPLKIDRTKIFMTVGSLMKVENICNINQTSPLKCIKAIVLS